MRQAFLFAEAEHGSFADWDKEDAVYNQDGSRDYNASADIEERFFNTYLKPYIKYVKYERGYQRTNDDGDRETDVSFIYLADGSIVRFQSGWCFDFDLDVNGDKQPNSAGRDRFVWQFCGKRYRNGYFGNSKTYWATRASDIYPASEGGRDDRTKLLDGCKRYGWACARLLEFDNWEFKEDYPYKL